MKKLVFAALAIAAMAACTKSNVQYEQPGEISLQPVTQKATKSAITSTTYPTSAQFNVWAWWGEGNPGSNDVTSFTTKYIDEGTFGFRTGSVNSWGGVTPYYWPTTGSLFFAGYSPAAAKNKAYDFDYDLQTKTLTIKEYEQSNETSSTYDLLWFDATDKSYDNNTNKNNRGDDVDGVPVVFKHALSWLTFKFNLADENTAKNWKVTKVELKGIETQADCNIVKGNAPVWSNHMIPNNDQLNDDQKEVAKTIVIYTNTDGEEISYVDKATWTNQNTTVDDFGGAILENNKNGVIVIPQLCASKNDAKLVVTYKLKNPARNPEYIDQNVELELTPGTNGTEWIPGKHYIYTIVFGANEILIVPEVDEWIEEVVEIEVIK